MILSGLCLVCYAAIANCYKWLSWEPVLGAVKDDLGREHNKMSRTTGATWPCGHTSHTSHQKGWDSYEYTCRECGRAAFLNGSSQALSPNPEITKAAIYWALITCSELSEYFRVNGLWGDQTTGSVLRGEEVGLSMAILPSLPESLQQCRLPHLPFAP